MKSNELHRLIKKSKVWIEIRHNDHVIYKHIITGKVYPVPIHGSKEVGTGILCKIMKEMEL